MARHDSRSPPPPAHRRTRDTDQRDRHADRPSYREDRDRDYYRSRARDDDRRADRDGYSEKNRDSPKRRDVKRTDGRRDERRRGDDYHRSPREHGRHRDQERGGPSRRSASPARRPRSPHSRSHSHSRSASAQEDKTKPNFAPSGLLAAATNSVARADGTTTVLKYNEPPEARKPSLGYRLYVFKGKEQVDLVHIHRQSAYLVGRDRVIADLAIDHPSCSKQHAVIQYRHVQQKDEYGGSKGVIKPFIIDLDSTNGTHVNDEAIPPSRYYELKLNDVIKFGQSTREYVLLHDEAS